MAVHVMVDLETLGVTPGSVVASIGAVVFDPLTSERGRSFYAKIDRASCEAAGLIADAKTLAWWAEQSEEARAELTRDARPVAEVLAEFAAFWAELGESPLFWCQGPSFDQAVLEAAYRAVGLQTPWKYNSGRCTRTIYDLSGILPDTTTGTFHNALDDAERQATAVSAGFLKIGQPQRTYEQLAAAYHAQDVAKGEPCDRDGLAVIATMLETWAPETFPANPHGQVHFARAMMESAAATIRAFLGASDAKAAA